MCPVMPQDESGDRLDSSSENQIIVILKPKCLTDVEFFIG